MRLNFWGVRGSLPAPGRHAWRYGGNTPCLDVRAGGLLFILDAGTGIRELGQQLMEEFSGSFLEAHLLLTHYHWDQVQGLPFFKPLYSAGHAVHIFGPRPESQDPSSLKGVVEAIFRPPFFPIAARQLQINTLLELNWKSDFTLSGVRIRTCRLNHPQGAMAYRLDDGQVSFVYATDHEPGNREADGALGQLARGANLLVSDAQYRPDELKEGKAGWGHGSWKASVDIARAARVKNLVLFHHEPFRSDEELDHLVHQARRLFPHTWAAAEGMILEVTRKGIQVSCRNCRLSQRSAIHAPVRIEARHNGTLVRHQARLQNMSLQGAYFLSPHFYDPEEPVDLLLRLPANGQGSPRHSWEEGRFRVRGYVLRAEPQATADGWFGIAVHFPASHQQFAPHTSGQKANRPSKSRRAR